MLTLLVVDDDEEVRNQAMRALAGPHFRLASAADGRLALEQAALLKPDIVICDVDMPEMNGFDVLAALKADPAHAQLQVMMLTAQSSRHAMRLGMSLGADDYLTKPFSAEELVEAVEGLIKRRGRLEVFKDSVTQQEDSLHGRFSNSKPPRESTLVTPPMPLPAGAVNDAAVLYAGIDDFNAIAGKLSAPEVERLLTEYFHRVGEPVLAHGGQNLRLMGDHLVAMFLPEAARPVPHPHRALLAATEIAQTAPALSGWMQGTFADSRLPDLTIGIGLHVGAVDVDAETGMLGGPAVNVAERLKAAAMDLDWTIVASHGVASLANAAVDLGKSAQLVVAGLGQPLPVSEVLQAKPPEEITLFEKTVPIAAPRVAGEARPPRLEAEVMSRLRQSVQTHATQTARSVKDALGDKLALLRSSDPSDTGQPVQLEGFTIVRRLGAGGMSSIYLARRDRDGALVVLKVMQLDPTAKDLTARFVREFSLLSTIEHPNIVRIFNQGFTDDMAYIAMEYFENGDLRSRLKGPMPLRQVVRVLSQVAGALAAIHELGIIHRDLKPENLMVRANGDVVLADFGIAKVTAVAGGAQATLTVTGEVLGSPSYMSPEQIAGKAVTPLSDLYSLGVMLYEMSTGLRPFRSSSLVDLLSMHHQAQVPSLTGEHTVLQPVLDRLMAKQPEGRYGSAAAVIRDLQAIDAGA